MKYLLENGMIHGDCMTVTGCYMHFSLSILYLSKLELIWVSSINILLLAGKTVAENLANTKAIAPDNPIVYPLSDPIKPTGHLQILYGNLAPEGSVAKITGKEGLVFEGNFNLKYIDNDAN
jgi:dihydroxy-acid dehydratase